MDCDFVCRGETIEEAMAEAAQHGKEAHGFTDEQLQEPNMMERMRESMKVA
jgi:predicted small metal-binding protein